MSGLGVFKMTTLSPQSVLITGANRGLGLEFVKQFLQLPKPPKHIFAGCRDPDNATALQGLASSQSHTNVRLVKVDVQNDEGILAAAAEVEGVVGESGLNLLLNNAGVNNQQRGIDLLTRESLNKHFDIHVSGTMMVSKAFLPLLRKAATKGDPTIVNCNRAAVVNITSSMSLIGYVDKRNDHRYPYCTAKCALNMATSQFANEVAGDGILAALLHPGWVKTDMGGPQGMLEIPESISQCMKTLSILDQSSSGRLFWYDGVCKKWTDTD